MSVVYCFLICSRYTSCV